MIEPGSTILLTGGTGFLGGHVLDRLLERGYRVRALVRSGSEEKLPSGTDALEPVNGDIRNGDEVRDAADGCDAAIHLVGILRERGEATYQAVHIAGTNNVTSACRARGVKRLVHMSALGAGRGVDTPYFYSKEKAETNVQGSGLDWTILRPSIIHGPKSEFMKQMARMVCRWMPVPLVGSGRQTIQPVWAGDVAEMCVRALERPRTITHVYEVGGPRVLYMREFYQVLSKALRGKRTWVVPVPKTIVRIGAWIDEMMLTDPPITTDELKMLLAARPCNIRPVEADFDIEPQPFADTLETYADRLKAEAGIT